MESHANDNSLPEDVSTYDTRTLRHSVGEVDNSELPESGKTLELLFNFLEGRFLNKAKEAHDKVKDTYPVRSSNAVVPLLQRHGEASSVKLVDFLEYDASWTDEISENTQRIHIDGAHRSVLPPLMLNFARLTGLKSIFLENVSLPESTLQSIIQVPGLVSLRIERNHCVTGEHLGELSQTLKILVLKTRVLDEEKVIGALGQLRERGAQLRIVAFWRGDTMLRQAHCFALNHFESLQKIDVGVTPSLIIKEDGLEVPSMVNSNMTRLNLLFEVPSINITRSAVLKLFCMPHNELVDLELTDNDKSFSPGLLQHVLQSCPKLQTLKLNNFNNFQLDASMFVEKKTLRKVLFTDAYLTDAFLLALIKGLPQMTCVTIIHTPSHAISHRFSRSFVRQLIHYFWYNPDLPELDFRAFELGALKPLFSGPIMPYNLKLWIRLTGM